MDQIKPVGADPRNAEPQQRVKDFGAFFVPANNAETSRPHPPQPLRREQRVRRRVALPARMHIARAAATR